MPHELGEGVDYHRDGGDRRGQRQAPDLDQRAHSGDDEQEVRDAIESGGIDEVAVVSGTDAVVMRMALLALLVGLGLAHHRTIVLALPGAAVYLLWSVPGIWRPRRAWLLWLAALLLPLLLYLYLPLRAAMGAADLHGSYTNTWAG